MTHPLSQADFQILEHHRFKRLHQAFPWLAKCNVVFQNQSRSLVVMAAAEFCAFICDNLDELIPEAFYICHALTFSLYAESELLFSLPCIPKNKSSNKIKKTFGEDEVMVTAAVLEKADLTSSNGLSSDQMILPRLRNLATLSTRTNIPVEQIAIEIRHLGFLVGSENGSYLAQEEGVIAWADNWLNRDLEERRAELLGDISVFGNRVPTPVATPDSKMRKPRKLRQDSATVAQKGDRRNFRNFTRGNSYGKTIGNFLAAQGWTDTDPKRIEFVQALTNAGTDPAAIGKETWTDRAITKILSKYARSDRQSALTGLIRAAKKMTGAMPEDEASNA